MGQLQSLHTLEINPLVILQNVSCTIMWHAQKTYHYTWGDLGIEPPHSLLPTDRLQKSFYTHSLIWFQPFYDRRVDSLRVLPDAALSLTLSAELIFDGLHASFLLDEVVDDFGGLLVLQLGLGDAAHIEEVLQIRVQVVHLDKEEGRRVERARWKHF